MAISFGCGSVCSRMRIRHAAMSQFPRVGTRYHGGDVDAGVASILAEESGVWAQRVDSNDRAMALANSSSSSADSIVCYEHNTRASASVQRCWWCQLIARGLPLIEHVHHSLSVDGVPLRGELAGRPRRTESYGLLSPDTIGRYPRGVSFRMNTSSLTSPPRRRPCYRSRAQGRGSASLPACSSCTIS